MQSRQEAEDYLELIKYLDRHSLTFHVMVSLEAALGFDRKRLLIAINIGLKEKTVEGFGFGGLPSAVKITTKGAAYFSELTVDARDESRMQMDHVTSSYGWFFGTLANPTSSYRGTATVVAFKGHTFLLTAGHVINTLLKQGHAIWRQQDVGELSIEVNDKNTFQTGYGAHDLGTIKLLPGQMDAYPCLEMDEQKRFHRGAFLNQFVGFSTVPRAGSEIRRFLWTVIVDEDMDTFEASFGGDNDWEDEKGRDTLSPRAPGISGSLMIIADTGELAGIATSYLEESKTILSVKFERVISFVNFAIPRLV